MSDRDDSWAKLTFADEALNLGDHATLSLMQSRPQLTWIILSSRNVRNLDVPLADKQRAESKFSVFGAYSLLDLSGLSVPMQCCRWVSSSGKGVFQAIVGLPSAFRPTKGLRCLLDQNAATRITILRSCIWLSFGGVRVNLGALLY